MYSAKFILDVFLFLQTPIIQNLLNFNECELIFPGKKLYLILVHFLKISVLMPEIKKNFFKNKFKQKTIFF